MADNSERPKRYVNRPFNHPRKKIREGNQEGQVKSQVTYTTAVDETEGRSKADTYSSLIGELNDRQPFQAKKLMEELWRILMDQDDEIKKLKKEKADMKRLVRLEVEEEFKSELNAQKVEISKLKLIIEDLKSANNTNTAGGIRPLGPAQGESLDQIPIECENSAKPESQEFGASLKKSSPQKRKQLKSKKCSRPSGTPEWARHSKRSLSSSESDTEEDEQSKHFMFENQKLRKFFAKPQSTNEYTWETFNHLPLERQTEIDNTNIAKFFKTFSLYQQFNENLKILYGVDKTFPYSCMICHHTRSKIDQVATVGLHNMKDMSKLEGHWTSIHNYRLKCLICNFYSDNAKLMSGHFLKMRCRPKGGHVQYNLETYGVEKRAFVRKKKESSGEDTVGEFNSCSAK